MLSGETTDGRCRHACEAMFPVLPMSGQAQPAVLHSACRREVVAR